MRVACAVWRDRSQLAAAQPLLRAACCNLAAQGKPSSHLIVSKHVGLGAADRAKHELVFFSGLDLEPASEGLHRVRCAKPDCRWSEEATTNQAERANALMIEMHSDTVKLTFELPAGLLCCSCLGALAH